MTISHGPTVAIMLSFGPNDLLGVRFYPNAADCMEEENYTKGKKISLITGEELADDQLGGEGPGYAFMVENDELKTLSVSFTAKPDANKWVSHLQANGLGMLHEPGYEMVLAALRKICESPA